MWAFQSGSPYPPQADYLMNEKYCGTIDPQTGSPYAGSLNDIAYFSRTNWRLATEAELMALNGSIMTINADDYWTDAVQTTAGTATVVSIPAFTAHDIDMAVKGSQAACVSDNP
jgi:hypothetical protein